jgi:enoyl-CoA hydratase/carnithine racemase
MREELDTAIVEYDEDTGVGEITMNRPDSLNALSAQLRSDIVAGLRLLEEQNEGREGVALRAVILEGAGDRAFCAGADITEFGGGQSGDSLDRSHYRVVRDFPTPIIAKVQGYCLGGGFETALSADFRFASEDSTFGFPEVDLGFLPGAGGAAMVNQLAGPGVAKELAMTGEHISAERAAEEGLVHDVFPAEDLDDEVAEFAETIAGKAPLAIQGIKRSVDNAVEVGMEAGIAFDGEKAAVLARTEDFAEGTAAFAEKREPEFQGK